jgi:hypothetical protein
MSTPAGRTLDVEVAEKVMGIAPVAVDKMIESFVIPPERVRS